MGKQQGSTQQLRILHFTPLRYPGGKAKLAPFVKSIVQTNGLTDGHYVEPYAGGAGLAVQLLLHEYVQHIHINDISRPVFAFWSSVLYNTEKLAKLIMSTPLNVRTWDKQKHVLMNQREHDDLELGFATFFLNRTNRSGVLNGGIIGGRDQRGVWKIDARFNRNDLVARIEAIARLRRRISLTCHDAIEFLGGVIPELPRKTLIYLDPPYYRKGKDLYYDYYNEQDHVEIADVVRRKLKGRTWIVSYDDTPEVRQLYAPFQRIVYEVGYNARDVRTGREIMFLSSDLSVPAAVGSMRVVSRRGQKEVS